MLQNGSERLRLVLKSSDWLRLAQHGSEKVRMAEQASGWLKMVPIEVQKGSDWLNLAQMLRMIQDG